MEQAESITRRVESVSAFTGVARSARPPIPTSAKLELTARCDLRCFFCASHKRPRRTGRMSPAFYIELAAHLRRAGVEQLGLFYIGESFLCEWLPDAIQYAKEVCRYPYVFLTTNGLTATPERVRACIVAGLDSLKFAFNWASPDQFQNVTGVTSSVYATVVGNLKSARSIRDDVQHESGHRCSLYASSLCYDEAQRGRMQAALKDIEPYVDQHYWLPLLGHWGLPGQERAGWPVPVKPLPCWPLFTEAHITWDGKLSACGLDASPRFHMGDLNRTPFAEAWHSDEFQALRAAHLAGELKGTTCAQCIAYEPASGQA